MPTAAKLIAALLLALMAMIVSEQYKPYMPEGWQFGNFTFVNAGVALVIGWKLVGGRVGDGAVSAINNGITAVLSLLIVLVFYHSFRLMILESMGAGYNGLVDALQDVIRKMTKYGLLLLHTEIITTLGVGAVITSLSAESISRRWR